MRLSRVTPTLLFTLSQGVLFSALVLAGLTFAQAQTIAIVNRTTGVSDTTLRNVMNVPPRTALGPRCVLASRAVRIEECQGRFPPEIGGASGQDLAASWPFMESALWSIETPLTFTKARLASTETPSALTKAPLASGKGPSVPCIPAARA